MQASVNYPPGRRPRSPASRVRSRCSGCAQSGHAAHGLGQRRAGCERAAQAQRRPGPVERTYRAAGLPGRNRTAARRHQVGQFGTVALDRPLRPECGKPGSVPLLRLVQCRRATAGKTSRRFQVLRSVGLDADEQVEAVTVEHADK